jgi:hypothetical protein
MRKNIKKTLKDNLSKLASFCKQTRLSQRSIGILMRSFHISTPPFLFMIMLFAPHILCCMALLFLFVVIITFYLFGGCWLSMLEKDICEDDFTIADPNLELLKWEINNYNRFYISNVIGLAFLISILLVYYVRFLRTHN